MPVRTNALEHHGILLDTVQNIEALPLGEMRPEVFLSTLVTATTARKVKFTFHDAETKTLMYARPHMTSTEEIQNFYKVPLLENWFAQGMRYARGLKLEGDSSFSTNSTIGFAMLKDDKDKFVNSLLMHCPRKMELIINDVSHEIGSDEEPVVPSLKEIPGSGVLRLMDVKGIVRETVTTSFATSYVYRDFKVNSKSIGDAFASVYALLAPSPKTLPVPEPSFEAEPSIWRTTLEHIVPGFQNKHQMSLGSIQVAEMSDDEDLVVVSRYSDLCDLVRGTGSSTGSWCFRFNAAHPDASNAEALSVAIYSLLDYFVVKKKCSFCNKLDAKHNPFPLCQPEDLESACCDVCFEQYVLPQRVKVAEMRSSVPFTPDSSMQDSSMQDNDVHESATMLDELYGSEARGHHKRLFEDEEESDNGFGGKKPPKVKRTRRPTHDPVADLRWRMERRKFAQVLGQGGVRRGEAYEAMIDNRIEEEKLEAIANGVPEMTFEALVAEWRRKWK
jgi:hypothetical protein